MYEHFINKVFIRLWKGKLIKMKGCFCLLHFENQWYRIEVIYVAFAFNGFEYPFLWKSTLKHAEYQAN